MPNKRRTIRHGTLVRHISWKREGRVVRLRDEEDGSRSLLVKFKGIGNLRMVSLADVEKI